MFDPIMAHQQYLLDLEELERRLCRDQGRLNEADMRRRRNEAIAASRCQAAQDDPALPPAHGGGPGHPVGLVQRWLGRPARRAAHGI